MSGVHGLATTFGRIPFNNHTSTTMIKGMLVKVSVFHSYKLIFCIVVYLDYIEILHTVSPSLFFTFFLLFNFPVVHFKQTHSY